VYNSNLTCKDVKDI